MAADEATRIAHLTELFGGASDRLAVPPGDDAAVVRTGGEFAVTSVDAVVDGVHFNREHYPPRAIGHKATAAALSDLAAMGVAAGEVYVAAGIPRDLSDDDFAELADGIADAAQACDAIVAGGDLTASPQLWLSVTVVGYASTIEDVLTRSGARAGDVLAVTGDLGRSAAALELLETDASELLQRQFAPTPRIAAGQTLAKAGATAMIDVSDGLAQDAGHIARMSGVAITIELAAVPVDQAVVEFTQQRGVHAAEFAAASGEEYELLVTLPADRLEAAVKECAAAGVELTKIGFVERADGPGAATSVDQAGRVVEIAGFDHFD